MTTNACDVCHISTFGTPSGNASFVNMVHGLHASAQMNLNYSIAGIVGADITYPQDIRDCRHLALGRPAHRLHQRHRSGPAYLMMPGVQACTSCHEHHLPAQRRAGRGPSPLQHRRLGQLQPLPHQG